VSNLAGIACPSTSDCTALGVGTEAVVGALILSGTNLDNPSVTTTSLPTGTTGFKYSATLSASGGISPYTWSVVSGSLPPGLSLNPTSGVITGIPTNAGSFRFTVEVAGANVSIATKALSIEVDAAPITGCSSTGVGSANFPGGYWIAGANGAVYSCGNAPFYGSLKSLGITPAKAIVGIAATPDNKGYWLVASDGGVFAFGDAKFYGSMAGKPLNDPVVGMTSTPKGGYYEVASDGGIFSFGPGTPFLGSMGGKTLNQPVVAMAVDPTGGYYEVASDGGVFAFGAPFHESAGCTSLNQPIAAMEVSTNTSTVGTGTACGFNTPQSPGGYQFVAADGGVFSFGNAVFAGSLGGQGVTDIVGMANS
jgi:hypothetical protein